MSGEPLFLQSLPLYRSSPTLALCLPKWEQAMGACFHFELCVRLLAQKHFLGESVSTDVGDQKRKPGLLTMLFGRLQFSDEEREFLPKCNRLRNKLIHCEPDKVVAVLREIVPEFRPTNKIQELKFGAEASAEEMIEVIRTRRNAINVQDTTSRQEGFLGWMMQAAHDGTFHLTAQVLGKAIMILNSKATQA